jgi:hypothetical protein
MCILAVKFQRLPLQITRVSSSPREICNATRGQVAWGLEALRKTIVELIQEMQFPLGTQLPPGRMKFPGARQ